MKSLKFVVAAAFAFGSIDAANAQQQQVQLSNAMRSVIDVYITPVGGQTLPTITIAENQLVDFSYNGQLFDVQVIPRDEPSSGYRLDDANLGALASNGVVTLRGEFEKGAITYEWRCCCCRKHGHVRRYMTCVPVEGPPGARIAVTLEGTLKDGTQLLLRSVKMSYEEAMRKR